MNMIREGRVRDSGYRLIFWTSLSASCYVAAGLVATAKISAACPRTLPASRTMALRRSSRTRQDLPRPAPPGPKPWGNLIRLDERNIFCTGFNPKLE